MSKDSSTVIGHQWAVSKEPNEFTPNSLISQKLWDTKQVDQSCTVKGGHLQFANYIAETRYFLDTRSFLNVCNYYMHLDIAKQIIFQNYHFSDIIDMTSYSNPAVHQKRFTWFIKPMFGIYVQYQCFPTLHTKFNQLLFPLFQVSFELEWTTERNYQKIIYLIYFSIVNINLFIHRTTLL